MILVILHYPWISSLPFLSLTGALEGWPQWISPSQLASSWVQLQTSGAGGWGGSQCFLWCPLCFAIYLWRWLWPPWSQHTPPHSFPAPALTELWAARLLPFLKTGNLHTPDLFDKMKIFLSSRSGSLGGSDIHNCCSACLNISRLFP